MGNFAYFVLILLSNLFFFGGFIVFSSVSQSSFYGGM